MIDRFANYGFNKSHSVAYSLLAHQTAWLKANYTPEFMAAMMTAAMDKTDDVVVLDVPLLVETGRDDHNRQTLRTTDMLGLVSSSDPIADLSPPAGPAIVVHPDLRIDLIDPSPLRVWSISAFADTRSLRPLASYQLSAESVRRALANGASLLDVTTWSDADRRIVMRLIARITTDADRQAGQLGTVLREAGWEVEQRDQALEVVLDLATAEKQITELQSLVRKLGFRETRKPPDHYPEVVNGSGDS